MNSNKQVSSKVVQSTAKLKIDYPHKLKPYQIEALNELVSTVGKYEHQLNYLGIVCHTLFREFAAQGQVKGTEIEKLYLSVRDIYHALIPWDQDGSFDRYNGLQGKWNEETKSYDRFI